VTDTMTPSHDAEADAVRPAGERGTLDVRTKALEHLVAQAALQVPGCVARPAGVHRLARSLPSASVTFRGSVAVAELHAAATWPCRVQELATTIRDAVRTEASRLSGTDIGRVDVTLHVVPADETVGGTPHRTRRVL
jgi:uncharacterized alkaline shock family protein YloU